MASPAINQKPAPAPPPRSGFALVGVSQLTSLEQLECLLGVSTHVAELKQFIAAQAAQHQPVVLIGERGLRQEQVAQALHRASEHSGRPFFAVNARSLSPEPLHQLLFGPRGMMEAGQGGTIFVNELVNLPLLLQQRFAAYIEEQRWQARSGRQRRLHLVFATEWRPEEMRAENRIAYGLIELLRPSSFFLKPLRERGEDIPYLAAHLAERIARRLNKGALEITPEAITSLTDYPWERNIDELEAVLESAIAAMRPHQVGEDLLPSRVRSAVLRSIPPEGINLPQLVDDYEWALINTALRQASGHQNKAAQLLGLRVQTLNMKLKRQATSPGRV